MTPAQKRAAEVRVARLKRAILAGEMTYRELAREFGYSTRLVQAVANMLSAEKAQETT